MNAEYGENWRPFRSRSLTRFECGPTLIRWDWSDSPLSMARSTRTGRKALRKQHQRPVTSQESGRTRLAA